MRRKTTAVMIMALAGALVGCFDPKGGNMKLPDNADLLDVRRIEEFVSRLLDAPFIDNVRLKWYHT